LSGLFRQRWHLATIITVAVALRVGCIWHFSANLLDDRDAYLGLAEQLRLGHGFSVPDSAGYAPTAYRPPLYSLLLSALPHQRLQLGIAALHVLLGGLTVWLTYQAAVRLKLDDRAALIAAGIVACDPLLLMYATFPMTETVCAFLAVGLLAATIRCQDGGLRPLAWGVAAGVALAACILSRPTFLVFAGLLTILATWQTIRRRSPESLWIALIVAAVLVTPWPLRNWHALGAPIVTTTHGGYTLLLGNNPAFYHQVVAQPLGTVWDGSHGPGQEVWVQQINQQMDDAGLVSEIERDRWMSQRAWQNIREAPEDFVRACGLRLLRFWNIVPSGSAGTGIPIAIKVCVAIFYVIVFGLALAGLVSGLRHDPTRWLPAILLIASFTTVHLFYWSNARMRAPVMPAVALLAALPLSRRNSNSQSAEAE